MHYNARACTHYTVRVIHYRADPPGCLRKYGNYNCARLMMPGLYTSSLSLFLSLLALPANEWWTRRGKREREREEREEREKRLSTGAASVYDRRETSRDHIAGSLHPRGAAFPPLSRPLSLIVTVRNRCCFIGGCKVISRLECLVFNPVDHRPRRCMTLRVRVPICTHVCRTGMLARTFIETRRWYFVGKFLLPRRILVWTGNDDYR